uniref:Uncharacterized protein n=1 Tax=Anguilla anguilla TaxID=7936 RepID=A0A0E9TCA5_ANGAN
MPISRFSPFLLDSSVSTKRKSKRHQTLYSVLAIHNC